MKNNLSLLASVCAIAFEATIMSSQAAAEPISSKPFGQTATGQPITLHTLTNGKGMTVSIMDYGATIVNLIVPDRNGKPGDIVLGFDGSEPYFKESPYFGATIGRYGNRIAKGIFQLNGETYHLATNNNGNSLHGGKKGFDKQMWKAESLAGTSPAIRFSRTSPDGEEGYPGKLEVAVIFTVTDKNELRIAYEASTDKPTVLNLTNHSYFNLAGAGNGTILHQLMTIHAGKITPVDAQLIPTGKLQPVDGTPWDFRQGKAIGTDLRAVGGDPVGYDHNYVLDQGAAVAAEVFDPESGRVMAVTTDQPGIQFYSGNFLDGTVTGKGGKAYPQYAAFCLETQHFPDSPNQPEFPSTVLKPGEIFKSTTVYTFATR